MVEPRYSTIGVYSLCRKYLREANLNIEFKKIYKIKMKENNNDNEKKRKNSNGNLYLKFKKN